jgi:hypothetical protein
MKDALRAMQEAGARPCDYLRRHLTGSWGIVSNAGHQANACAVREGGRILSLHRLKDGTKIWIIIEADRSATTILMSAERARRGEVRAVLAESAFEVGVMCRMPSRRPSTGTGDLVAARRPQQANMKRISDVLVLCVSMAVVEPMHFNLRTNLRMSLAVVDRTAGWPRSRQRLSRSESLDPTSAPAITVSLVRLGHDNQRDLHGGPQE